MLCQSRTIPSDIPQGMNIISACIVADIIYKLFEILSNYVNIKSKCSIYEILVISKFFYHNMYKKSIKVLIRQSFHYLFINVPSNVTMYIYNDMYMMTSEDRFVI